MLIIHSDLTITFGHWLAISKYYSVIPFFYFSENSSQLIYSFPYFPTITTSSPNYT